MHCLDCNLGLRLVWEPWNLGILRRPMQWQEVTRSLIKCRKIVTLRTSLFRTPSHYTAVIPNMLAMPASILHGFDQSLLSLGWHSVQLVAMLPHSSTNPDLKSCLCGVCSDHVGFLFAPSLEFSQIPVCSHIV